MSALGDRLRRAAASVGQALGGRRPGVELVRVDQPELLAPLPLQPLPALPAPEHPICGRCGLRHEPRPLFGRGSGGTAAAYGRTILPDPTRPEPLGRGPADVSSLARDSAGAWTWGHRRPLLLEPPPPSGQHDQLRAELEAHPAGADPDPPPAEAGLTRPPGWRGLRLVDVARRLGQPPPWA